MGRGRAPYRALTPSSPSHTPIIICRKEEATTSTGSSGAQHSEANGWIGRSVHRVQSGYRKCTPMQATRCRVEADTRDGSTYVRTRSRTKGPSASRKTTTERPLRPALERLNERKQEEEGKGSGKKSEEAAGQGASASHRLIGISTL